MTREAWREVLRQMALALPPREAVALWIEEIFVPAIPPDGIKPAGRHSTVVYRSRLSA